MKKVELTLFCISTCSKREGDYLVYLVKEIKKYSDKLVLIVSENIEKDLIDEFLSYSDEIIKSRYNTDALRWADYLNKMTTAHSEILFLNDSFFGPLISLDNFFDKALISECGLYGMTAHEKMWVEKKSSWPRFVQTYFFILKREVLDSQHFKLFIKSLFGTNIRKKSQEIFEFTLTAELEKAGFSWDVYIKTECNGDDGRYFESDILFNTYKLIKQGFPFLPKYLFDLDMPTCFFYERGDNLKNCFDYIEKNTKYDIGLIVRNILQRIDSSIILQRMQKRYVIGTGYQYSQNKQCVHNLKSSGVKKTAVFAYLYYRELIEKSIDYILNVPSSVDIYIATDTTEKCEYIRKYIEGRSDRKYYIRLHKGNGRDISALLVTFRTCVVEYDIICFVHDKKSEQMLFRTVGADFNRQMWDCCLKSTEYVKGILDLFDNNRVVGLLVPPMVTHGMYFNTAIDAWTINYECTVKIANELGLSVPISREVSPVSLGTCFWCRTKALKKLFARKWSFEDFPEEPIAVDGTISHGIERVFSYVAADAGFLTGQVMDEDTAVSIVSSHYELQRNVLYPLMKRGKDVSTLLALKNTVIAEMN